MGRGCFIWGGQRLEEKGVLALKRSEGKCPGIGSSMYKGPETLRMSLSLVATGVCAMGRRVGHEVAELGAEEWVI